MENISTVEDQTLGLQNMMLETPEVEKTVERPATTSFHRFPDLPPELRQLIWTFTLESRRIIGIASLRFFEHAQSRETFLRGVVPTGLPYPTLNTNKEAREATLRVVQNLTPASHNGLGIPKIWGSTSKDILWFHNAQYDELHRLLDWVYRKPSSSPTRTEIAISYEAFCELLRDLCDVFVGMRLFCLFEKLSSLKVGRIFVVVEYDYSWTSRDVENTPGAFTAPSENLSKYREHAEWISVVDQCTWDVIKPRDRGNPPPMYSKATTWLKLEDRVGRMGSDLEKEWAKSMNCSSRRLLTRGRVQKY
ncbi:hypothetical protein ONS96_005869 [Cadophora gregata f. sp. sojae]|nr:hypothetical protein ONS96_005869 [Cadophora gregata f. sp. sojae]